MAREAKGLQCAAPRRRARRRHPNVVATRLRRERAAGILGDEQVAGRVEREIVRPLEIARRVDAGLHVVRDEGARAAESFEVNADDALGMFALLMHADRAVHEVVGADHDRLAAVLEGGGDLEAAHAEAAVADEADHRALGVDEARRHHGRHRIAHRARGRPELALRPAVVEIALRPARVVARVDGGNRVLRQERRQLAHRAREVESAVVGRRLDRAEIIAPRLLEMRAPARGIERRHIGFVYDGRILRANLG